MRRSSLAGIGAIAFAVLTFVAVIIEHSPGGNYKTSNVEKFLKHGHRPVIFVATYMVYLGVVGLVFLLTRLRDSINDPTRSNAFWTLSVAGMPAWLASPLPRYAAGAASGIGLQALLDGHRRRAAGGEVDHDVAAPGDVGGENAEIFRILRRMAVDRVARKWSQGAHRRQHQCVPRGTTAGGLRHKRAGDNP